MNKVLITGASGLLGRALVNRFTSEKWFVFAHYFSNKGEDGTFCRWLYGDFRTMEGISGFLKKNCIELKGCTSLVNNYGPITYKNASELTPDEVLSDFHANLIVAKVITDQLLADCDLMSVVNIGYEGAGSVRPYRKILSYAMAKSALLLLTRSYEKEFPDTGFQMVSPPSLTGGQYGAGNGPFVTPGSVADQVFEAVMSGGKYVQG
jgi:NAD(P)-dependent dehydrogenase (short-subunit alcohol dehydrogenase family)